MVLCPVGHQSSTSDYCSICGTPMAGPHQPAPPEPNRSAAQTCPVCQSVADADAFFCESCGYDFLTGSLPRSAVQQSQPPETARPPRPEAGEQLARQQATGQQSVVPASSPDETLATADQPPQVELVAEPPSPPAATTFDLDHVPDRDPWESPLAVEPAATPRLWPAPSTQTSTQALSLGEPERDLPRPDELRPIAVPPRPGLGMAPPGAPAARNIPPASTPSGTYSPAPQPLPRPGPGPARWVAEIWIDPEWYRVQQAPEQLPSPGQPLIHALRKPTIVIGRTSPSGSPDLDCVSDTGVSRRQAVLTTDGIRWFLEDLGSSNGTYVAQVDQPMPLKPISGRVELGPHDRIYVGSWTRIVVRPALVQEAGF